MIRNAVHRVAGRALPMLCVAGILLLSLGVEASGSPQPETGKDGGREEEADTSPPFRWAQRKDRILLTIDLQGVERENFVIDEGGGFLFEGIGAERDRRDEVLRYSLKLQMLKGLNASDSTCDGGCTNWRVDDRVDPTCTVAEGSGPWEHCTLSADVFNKTHCTVRSRDVHCVLIKAKRGPYWPHLLKDNLRPKNMHIDWSKWLDEEKDGVRWNKDADRPWEWWNHDDEEEDEEDEEEAAKREEEQKRQRGKFRKNKKKRATKA